MKIPLIGQAIALPVPIHQNVYGYVELLTTLVKIVILWILKLTATITLRLDGKTIASVYLGKNNVTPTTRKRYTTSGSR